GGFQIDDDIVLLGIDDPAHSGDLDGEAGPAKSLDLNELLAADLVPLGFDFEKADTALVEDDQIGTTAPLAAWVSRHRPEHGGERPGRRLGEEPLRQEIERVVPGKNGIGGAKIS